MDAESSADAGEPKERHPVRVVGRYALYDAIASGGMATVFIGRLVGPAGFSRTVAIKQLHPQLSADAEFVSMFLDEARLVARIRHPNVVQTLDVVATGGELFLVMDYVHGASLARLLAAHETLPLPIVIAIASGMLQGLHAEALAIVHRDVSPQNVLVGSDGGTRVLDFGVAKAAVRIQSTRDGQLKGKLEYMGPEQLMAEEVGQKLDIYAASVVLWEMVAGEGLFRAHSEGAILKKILASEVRPATAGRAATADAATRECLKQIDAIILRGLSRRPEDRFETAHAMAVALEAVVTPASAAQVGAWVESIAREDLAKQAGLVADIEGDRPKVSLRPAVAEEVARTMRAKAAAQEPTAPLRPDLLAARRNVDGGAVVTEALVVPTSRTGRWVGAGAAVALMLGGVALFASGRSRGDAHATAPMSPPSVPSATVAAVDSAPPIPVPPVAAPSATASSSVATRPQRARSAASKNSSDGTSRAQGGARAGCSPPFTYDATGVKHYKPECPL
jgi:hypothetical protein